MSKGTDRYTVRLPSDLMSEVATTIYRRNLHAEGEPWDLSAFLRVAIREKLHKMERSRRKRLAAAKPEVVATCDLQLPVCNDEGDAVCPVDGRPCSCSEAT